MIKKILKISVFSVLLSILLFGRAFAGTLTLAPSTSDTSKTSSKTTTKPGSATSTGGSSVSATLTVATESTKDKSGTGPIRGAVVASKTAPGKYEGSIGFTVDFKGAQPKNMCSIQISNTTTGEIQKGFFYQNTDKKNCKGSIPNKTDRASFTKMQKGENSFVAITTYKDSNAKTQSSKTSQALINIDDDGMLSLGTPAPVGGESSDTGAKGESSAGAGDAVVAGAGIPAVDTGDLSEKQLSERLRTDKTLKDLWTVMLRLADAFVAIFFLAVGFATILHINYDVYSIKKAIMPLIVGIILAHFSLLIIQYFVDFAQVLSAGFFNSAATGGFSNCTSLGEPTATRSFACNLSSTFIRGGFDALGKVASGAIGIFAGFTALAVIFGAMSSVGALLAGPGALVLIVLVLAMLLIPTLLIMVLAFLLYIRVYVLIFLTIIAPLAWLAVWWTPVQGMFKKWWGQFSMWVFMGPIIMFFLWIAIKFHIETTPGDANLGTYLLTLVMIYLAIAVPFKIGGAIMSVWGGWGKKAGAVGAGYAYGMSNVGLEKFAQTETGKKLGVQSFRGIVSGIKKGYEERNEPYRILSESAMTDVAEQGVVSLYTRGLRRFIGGKLRNENMLDLNAVGNEEDREKKRGLRSRSAINADTLEKAKGLAGLGLTEKIDLAGSDDPNQAKHALVAAAMTGDSETFKKAEENYLAKHGVDGKEIGADGKPVKVVESSVQSLIDSEHVKAKNPLLIKEEKLRKSELGRMRPEDIGTMDHHIFEDALISKGSLKDAASSKLIIDELVRIQKAIEVNKKSGNPNTPVESTLGRTFNNDDFNLIDQALKNHEGEAASGSHTFKFSAQIVGKSKNPEIQKLGMDPETEKWINDLPRDIASRARKYGHGSYHHFYDTFSRANRPGTTVAQAP